LLQDPLGELLTALLLVAFFYLWVPTMWRTLVRRERWPGRRYPPDLQWRFLVLMGLGFIRVGYGFIFDAGTWLPGDPRNGGPFITSCYVLLFVVGPALVARGLWLGFRRLRERRRAKIDPGSPALE
jgi:hypothetical protein